MKEGDKKKYKMAIQMMEDGALEDFDDIPFDAECYKLICARSLTGVKLFQ